MEQFIPNFKLSRDPGEFKVMNNMEWHKKQSLLDFLRFTANYVRYQELAHKERFVDQFFHVLHVSVKLREACGTGMSVHEFLYPMLQAYDFAHLYQCQRCNVQVREKILDVFVFLFKVGGNDQIGNIDTGLALIRRKLAENAFGELCILFYLFLLIRLLIPFNSCC